MTIIRNTAEGGTAGVAVTTTNSGGTSGTAFAATTTGHTKFATAAAAHGTMGYQVDTPDGTAGYVALAGTPTGPFAAQMYFRLGGLPAGTTRHRFLALMNSTGTTLIAGLDLTPTGAVEVLSSAAMFGTATGAALKTGEWYRVHISGATGTSGSFRVLIQSSTGTTTLIDQTWTRDMGATLPQLMVAGQSTSATIVGFQFDDLAWQPDSSAMIPAEPFGTDPAPSTTATVKPNAGMDFTAEPGSTVKLLARGYNNATGKYVKTGTWSQVSGPAVSLSSTTSTDGVTIASFTAPKQGTVSTVTLRLTMTDGGGLTATDDVAITVPPWQQWSTLPA